MVWSTSIYHKLEYLGTQLLVAQEGTCHCPWDKPSPPLQKEKTSRFHYFSLWIYKSIHCYLQKKLYFNSGLSLFTWKKILTSTPAASIFFYPVGPTVISRFCGISEGLTFWSHGGERMMCLTGEQKHQRPKCGQNVPKKKLIMSNMILWNGVINCSCIIMYHHIYFWLEFCMLLCNYNSFFGSFPPNFGLVSSTRSKSTLTILHPPSKQA